MLRSLGLGSGLMHDQLVNFCTQGFSYEKQLNVQTNNGNSTGKSLSEALIFASTNPQYDGRLFIELQVQYMKIPCSEHGENMLCTEIVFDIQNNLCTQHVLSLEFSCTELVIQ